MPSGITDIFKKHLPDLSKGEVETLQDYFSRVFGITSYFSGSDTININKVNTKNITSTNLTTNNISYQSVDPVPQAFITESIFGSAIPSDLGFTTVLTFPAGYATIYGEEEGDFWKPATSENQIYVPAAGIYTITVSGEFQEDGDAVTDDNNHRSLWLTQSANGGGSDTIAVQGSLAQTVTGLNTRMTVTGTTFFKGDAYVKASVLQNSGGTLSFLPYNFSIFRVR